MSLFSNLYSAVAKFFRSQEETEEASKSVATNRLKLVLMQDRTNLTPRILEQMRSELIDLLSRYVELDKELLDLNFEQEGDQVALMLSIPVIRAKDEEEIEAAIKAHQESLSIKSDDNSDENDTSEVSEKDVVISDSEYIEEKNDTNVVEDTENQDIEEITEEAEEAKKADDIAKELQSKPTVIKKKKVSAPEDISNNPFRSENIEAQEKLESTSET